MSVNAKRLPRLSSALAARPSGGHLPPRASLLPWSVRPPTLLQPRPSVLALGIVCPRAQTLVRLRGFWARPWVAGRGPAPFPWPPLTCAFSGDSAHGGSPRFWRAVSPLTWGVGV